MEWNVCKLVVGSSLIGELGLTESDGCEPSIDTTLYCGDVFVKSSVTSGESRSVTSQSFLGDSPHFSCFLLEWVQSFDDETKQRLLLPRALQLRHGPHTFQTEIFHYFVLMEDFAISDLDYEFRPVTVWNYLCAHQDLQRVVTWINTHYSHDVESQHFPFNLPIEFSIYENLSNCSKYMKEEILNELARYNGHTHN